MSKAKKRLKWEDVDLLRELAEERNRSVSRGADGAMVSEVGADLVNLADRIASLLDPRADVVPQESTDDAIKRLLGPRAFREEGGHGALVLG